MPRTGSGKLGDLTSRSPAVLQVWIQVEAGIAEDLYRTVLIPRRTAVHYLP